MDTEDRHKIFIEIARIPICLDSPIPLERIRLRRSLANFISQPSAKPRLTVSAYYGNIPNVGFSDKKLLFKVEKLWSLYESDREHIFIHEQINRRTSSIPVKSAFLQGKTLNFPSTYYYDIKYLKEEFPLPYRVSFFNKDFTRGKIFIKSSDRKAGFYPNPLANNLLELIFSGILYFHRLGIVLHSCGIADGDNGYLIVGPVGAGKSTMAGLWQGQAAILHDDRIVIRRMRRGFFIFPTACFGRVELASGRGVRLKKIFFISHGRTNTCSRLKSAEALSGLLTQTQSDIPVWYPWYRRLIGFNSAFCMELAKEIPCYSLDFVPDNNVVDFIRRIG